MEHKKISKKVPGGKLVRIEFDLDERLHNIKITGDFFLHPEDALPGIEAALENALPQEVPVKLVMATLNVEFVGVTPEDLAGLILESIIPQP